MIGVLVYCAWCNRRCEKLTGAVNRARKSGLYVYCDRTCAGLAHRSDKSKAEKVEAKRLYDADYRAKNLANLKAKKAAYYAANHDREAEREYRQRTMHRHVEYCRRPEYRAAKAEYDRVHRADKMFGEYSEAFLVLMDLENEINARMSKYEIYMANGTINKSLQRRRAHARAYCCQSEDRPLGNAEFDQGRQDAGEPG